MAKVRVGDLVAFRTFGANSRLRGGRAVALIPKGTSAYKFVDHHGTTLEQLPQRRRRFVDVAKYDRVLVRVMRRDKHGAILNSMEYYAPAVERVTVQ